MLSLARILTLMQLTPEELDLLHAACADVRNEAAQELLNVFAAERSMDVVLQIPNVPMTLLSEVVGCLRRAIEFEHRQRTGCDLILIDDAD